MKYGNEFINLAIHPKGEEGAILFWLWLGLSWVLICLLLEYGDY